MTEEPRKTGFTGILQYLITLMVSIIGIFTTIIFFMLNTIKEDQTKFSTEMTRIKTVQDYNSGAVQSLDGRVKLLELNYVDLIKEWVDANYIRKPQK